MDYTLIFWFRSLNLIIFFFALVRIEFSLRR